MPSVAELLERANPKRLGTGVAILALTAFYSPIFVLTLSPVYGSVPANIFHVYGVALTAGAGWFLKDAVHRFSNRKAVYVLPVLAIWAPSIENVLLSRSSTLGNPTGPVVTGLLSYYPLVFLSVACAGKLIQLGLNLGQEGDIVSEHVPLITSYVVYSAGEHFANAFISKCIGVTSLFSTTGLQFLTTILYAAAVPSKLLLLAIPSILLNLSSNVHLPWGSQAELNSILKGEGYELLARQDSTTGYVSVLDNLHEGFRVMRCDHSLLGGKWTKYPQGYPGIHEPIYAIFTMLEAIRLIETDNGEPRDDAHSKALVIGLGVGTLPGALIQHGIDTTIVELDPVVHKFASQYFNLPPNHNAVIEDASKFVQRTQASHPAQYDYIVHDVFTGGAEPPELFTLEFIRGLNALLKPDGVIAINYAGDISLYPAALTVRTVQSVFPTCRMYREAAVAESNADFTNMVIFCKKSSSGIERPLRFREPVSADYLRSEARRSYLVPKHEIDPSRFANVEHRGRSVLVEKEVGRLHKYQDRGALEHWGLMRDVVPDAVWENW